MRRLPAFDRGWLVVLLIALPALWPFLRYAGLPTGSDVELHVYRLAELERMIAGGTLYPRWAANFYFGYGYPIFNYYAPLTYYLGALFSLLPGVTPVLGIKLVLIASLLAAAAGAYGLARAQWGRAAGWVAAVVYLYAPYLVYIDPHARGVAPETLSLGLLPLALWGVDRLRRGPSAARLTTAALGVAALLLAHNLMAMVGGGLLAGWLLWHGVRPLRRGFLLAGGTALALGLGLSAFFWLPMVLERNAIQISGVVAAGSHYDYRNHFLTLRDLLAATRRLDWGASEPFYRFNLGWAAVLLAAPGVVAVLRRRDRTAAGVALAALLLLLLMLPLSQPLWQALPLLPYLQFPWRLLGPLALLLALLAAAALPGMGRYAEPYAALAVALAIGLALPLLQVRPWGDFGPTDTAAVVNQEYRGRWLGTTSTADFVPTTVDVLPRAEEGMVAALRTGDEPERLNRFTLGDASVTSQLLSPTASRFVVDSPHDVVLRLYRFMFPGWRTTIDGAPATIEPGLPEGFITVMVPAGQHVVDVWFGSTPARQVAWALSGVSALALLAAGWWLARRPHPAPLHPTTPYSALTAGDAVPGRRVAGVALLMLLAQALVSGPAGGLHLASPPGVALPAQTGVSVDYGGVINLIGYDAPLTARPGQRLDVVLYWQAQRDLDDNYQVFVHVLDASGQIVPGAQSDKLNPGDFPTRRWLPQYYVRDAHMIQLPAQLPAGSYRLTAGLWSLESGQRLPVEAAAAEWTVLRTFNVSD